MMRDDRCLLATLNSMLPVGLNEVSSCYAGNSRVHLRTNLRTVCMRHEEERGIMTI